MSTETILGLLIGGVLIPLIAWNVVTLIQVRTVLFGTDESGGLSHRVTKLEVQQATHSTDIALLKQHEAK